jgi:hypothetical protein
MASSGAQADSRESGENTSGKRRDRWTTDARGHDGGGNRHSSSDRHHLSGRRSSGADPHHEEDHKDRGRGWNQAARPQPEVKLRLLEIGRVARAKGSIDHCYSRAQAYGKPRRAGPRQADVFPCAAHFRVGGDLCRPRSTGMGGGAGTECTAQAEDQPPHRCERMAVEGGNHQASAGNRRQLANRFQQTLIGEPVQLAVRRSQLRPRRSARRCVYKPGSWDGKYGISCRD